MSEGVKFITLLQAENDTQRLAGCVLFDQACDQARGKSTSSTPSIASARSYPHPLSSLLPQVWPLITRDDFLLRLLTSSQTLTLEIGNLAGTSYSTIGVRVLRELCDGSDTKEAQSCIKRCAETLIPPLCKIVETDQTQIKFDAVLVLGIFYQQSPSSASEDDEDASSSSSIVSLPLPSHLVSLRTGLTSLLSSSASLTQSVRLDALKLSRLVLQRYGPVWATGYGATSSSSSPPPPFTQYLQLLTSISTIELRLSLHDLASVRAEDIARVEKNAKLVEESAMECIQLFQTYYLYLTGDDEEEEETATTKALSPYQWYNLPVAILLHLQSQFSLSAEALLDYCISLSQHREHPRRPAIVRLCIDALREWMEGDTETHKGKREQAREWIEAQS